MHLNFSFFFLNDIIAIGLDIHYMNFVVNRMMNKIREKKTSLHIKIKTLTEMD